MFSKIKRTGYPPKNGPILIWDGQCGFCKYWITRLKKYTGNKINFASFQDAARHFPDIPFKEFEKASRLIEANGTVYSGPDSLYRGLEYSNKKTLPWHTWYTKNRLFTKVNDYGYNFIAKNRPLMFGLTKILFGRNPNTFRPYWLFYILLLLTAILVLSS